MKELRQVAERNTALAGQASARADDVLNAQLGLYPPE
jgi:hypothetical protein